MIKIWAYVIVLVAIAAVGLTVGSANDQQVTFDFLVVRADVSLATVFVIGTIFGIVAGAVLSLLWCWRCWRQARAAKAALARQLRQQTAPALPATAAPAGGVVA